MKTRGQKLPKHNTKRKQTKEKEQVSKTETAGFIFLWASRSLGTMNLVQNWGRSASGLYIVTLLVKLLRREDHARSAGLEEAQAGIEIVRRHINSLRYADTTVYGQKMKRD